MGLQIYNLLNPCFIKPASRQGGEGHSQGGIDYVGHCGDCREGNP